MQSVKAAEKDADSIALRAAKRLSEALTRADEGNYGHTGSAWASYMSRQDLEAVLKELEFLQGITKEIRRQG